MTFVFGSWTLGAALLFSAIKNMSLLELVRGETGPGQPPSIVDSTLAMAQARKNGGTTATTPGVGIPVKPKGRVKGHPELKPGIAAVTATVLKKFPKLTITATTNGTHVEGSLHYKGRAVDLAADPAYMKQAAQWIAEHLTPVLTEGIHNPNLSVKNHHHVSSSFWGSETWAGHANHIHLGV